MIRDENSIKGRGSQLRADNAFAKDIYCREHEEGIDLDVELNTKTKFIPVHPKTIVNKVDSPDLPLRYSMNPYQGCEHGCIYCYARNSHMYWGYEPALEFESKILFKENAAQLLRANFMKKSWQVDPIMLSGNTDCYQPLERVKKISRSLIAVCAEFGNPLGIITKNQLILRDIDILGEMAQSDLVHVYISLTSLDDELRSKMEPRTSTAKNRLKTIQQLSEAGIPVGVMLAPIIPGLNSHEIPELAKSAASAGASVIRHTMVRLNGSIGPIFMDWLQKTYSNKANKVINQIKDQHGGELNDSVFGRRMKGDGKMASLITQLVKKSERKYIKEAVMPNYNMKAFHRPGENDRLEGF